jgi:hypothetical protein
MHRLMPALEAHFHYRNLDVSTIKELARRWSPQVLAGVGKEAAHTALSDVRDSIAELRHYRKHMGPRAGLPAGRGSAARLEGTQLTAEPLQFPRLRAPAPSRAAPEPPLPLKGARKGAGVAVGISPVEPRLLHLEIQWRLRGSGPPPLTPPHKGEGDGLALAPAKIAELGWMRHRLKVPLPLVGRG